MPVPDDDHVSIRRADRELYARLEASGFAGHAWQAASGYMAAYCVEVMAAWLHTKEIFSRCTEKGFRLSASSMLLSSSEIADLSADVVVDALTTFRMRALVGRRRWDPDGGKSLRSWLMDGCVVAFPNVWRRFLTRTKADDRVDAREMLVAEYPDSVIFAPSAEDEALAARAVRDVVPFAQPVLCKALTLLALGYSQVEACELIGDGLTPRALEGQLYRLRTRLRASREA